MQDALQVTKVLADNCRSKGTAFRLGVHVPFLLWIPLVCVADGIWHPVMKRPCISRLNFIWFHPFNFVCLCRLYSRMSLLSFSQMIFTLDAMEEFVVRFNILQEQHVRIKYVDLLVFCSWQVTWFCHFVNTYILLIQLLLLSYPGGLGACWWTNLTPKKMSLMQ
jgi:hypothetical protein